MFVPVVSALDSTAGPAHTADPAHTARDGAVTFTLLGQLEVLKDGEDLAPTAPKILELLALLLTRPGRAVPSDSIIEELWSSRPPRSVRTTLQTYVYQLRKHIEQNGLAPDGEAMLITKPLGYLLRVDPIQVDVISFQRDCLHGRGLLEAGRYAEAAWVFRRALALWSGPALANVNCGPLLSAYVVDLQEQLRNARHLRVEAEIASGMCRELIGELRSLATADPLDEGVHGQLIRVLGRSGRRSDAMAAYRELRYRLDDELGVEPCDELQLLYQDLLSVREPAR